MISNKCKWTKYHSFCVEEQTLILWHFTHWILTETEPCFLNPHICQNISSEKLKLSFLTSWLWRDYLVALLSGLMGQIKVPMSSNIFPDVRWNPTLGSLAAQHTAAWLVGNILKSRNFKLGWTPHQPLTSHHSLRKCKKSRDIPD